MKHNEYILQKSICKYLQLQYPKILFLSDAITNVKLSIPQKARNKTIQKTDFHCPDLIIFEPKQNYHALLLELKIETPYKKNGRTIRRYDNNLTEDFVIGFLTNGTPEELEKRKTLFEALPASLIEVNQDAVNFEALDQKDVIDSETPNQEKEVHSEDFEQTKPKRGRRKKQ